MTSPRLARWATAAQAPDGPRTLAAMRIATAAVVLLASLGAVPGGITLSRLQSLASVDPRLRTLPRGMRWLDAFGDPFPPTALTVSWALVIVALVALLLGWRARWAAGVALAGTTYLFTLGYSFGKVDHGFMHLTWLLVLLAASPCDDTWSLRRPPGQRRTLDHALPVMVAWLLLAAIYLFPGAGKVAGAGLSWAWSDNLANQILEKRFALGWEGLVLFDTGRAATVLRLAAGAALLFEVGVVTLLWRRRTRLVAFVVGMSFHAGTALLMGIHFALTLTPLYVALLPWDPALRSSEVTDPSPAQPSTEARSPRRWSRAGQAALVVVVWLASATFVVERWPVSTYPVFAHVASDGHSEVVAVREAQVVRPLPQLDGGAATRAIGRSLSVPSARRALEDELGGPFTVCWVGWRLGDLSAVVERAVALDGSDDDCESLVGTRRSAAVS